jgi:hypothetical protein
LPYRGLGSDIPRAMAAWPKIELIDDRRGDQFKVIISRSVQRHQPLLSYQAHDRRKADLPAPSRFLLANRPPAIFQYYE